MKKLLLPLGVLSASLIFSCGHPEGEPKIVIDSVVEKKTDLDLLSKEKPAFDSALAASVGADEYGMHPYVMAILKEGPNRDQDSITADSIMREHLNNIVRLADEGKLIIAGPFLDDTDMKGIFIFNVATVEEAEALTKTDPAIISGRLTMELHPWYGSASMQFVNNLHHRIEKKSVAD